MKHQQSCTPNTGNGGNYYTFGAASVEEIGTPIGAEARNTICPKNWTLPKYSGNQSYVNLTTIYLGIDKNTLELNTSFEENLRSTPISFVRSGAYYYSSSTLSNRGSRGFFWSSRANSVTNAYGLRFLSTIIYPQYNNDKGSGFSLRCVAR